MGIIYNLGFETIRANEFRKSDHKRIKRESNGWKIEKLSENSNKSYEELRFKQIYDIEKIYVEKMKANDV